MTIIIKHFKDTDIDRAIALWQSFKEIELTVGDDREQLKHYLEKNDGSSFVAYDGSLLVGAILAGDDGRRGYLYHVAVHSDYQGQGIGSDLLEQAIKALVKRGIRKCHVFIFPWNELSKDFLAKHSFHIANNFITLSREI